MTTRDSFRKNFMLVLKALAPFVALMVIGFAAACSGGSWATFFSLSLPIAAVVGAVFWLGLSLTAAIFRRNNDVSVGGDGGNIGGGGGGASGSGEYIGRDINPATGQQTIMGYGSQDIGGNAWGENNNY